MGIFCSAWGCTCVCALFSQTWHSSRDWTSSTAFSLHSPTATCSFPASLYPPGKSGLLQGGLLLDGVPEGQGFLWPQDYGSTPTTGSAWPAAGSTTMSALGRQGSSLLGLIGQVLENVRCVLCCPSNFKLKFEIGALWLHCRLARPSPSSCELDSPQACDT